jgi:hypothetical protein
MTGNDWTAGDLAVCVAKSSGEWSDEGSGINPGPGPKTNEICKVVWVGLNDGILSLSFREYPRDRYAAHCFRKIRPDEPTACEEEFQILLKLSKRRVKA